MQRFGSNGNISVPFFSCNYSVAGELLQLLLLVYFAAREALLLCAFAFSFSHSTHLFYPISAYVRLQCRPLQVVLVSLIFMA